jgi:hypothetical protein
MCFAPDTGTASVTMSGSGIAWTAMERGVDRIDSSLEPQSGRWNRQGAKADAYQM